MFLLIPVSGWATTYYAATNGGGTTCDVENPCTIVYTIETMAESGDTVYLKNGAYVLTAAIDVPDGVNVQGESQAGVVVTYNSATGIMFGFSDGVAAQTMSYVTLDAESTTRWGIRVSKSNVTLHHITVEDTFEYGGIQIAGPPGVQADCSGTHITGIELYNITSTDASNDPGWGTGAIEIDGTSGAKIHDCNLTETAATSRVGIKATWDYGCNKGIEIYYNTIDVGINDD